jgi:hypothetical protein
LQSDASIFSIVAVYSTYLLVARVEIVGRQTHNGIGAAIDSWDRSYTYYGWSHIVFQAWLQ